MITKKQKALLILVSLLITLLFIESAARLAGFIYKNYRLGNSRIVINPDKNIIKILCLGDSFTFGSGSKHGKDYPTQLEKLLNENSLDNKFVVYNRGIPGNNSSMVLKSLVKNINTYKPDIVLLLIGSNDSTTLEDSDYYLFKFPGISTIASFSLKLDIFFSKLRTFKLIKILILNLRNKFCPGVDLADIDAQETPDYLKKKTNEGPHKSPDSDRKEIYLKQAEFLCDDDNDEQKLAQAEKILMDMPGGVDSGDWRECLLLSEIYLRQDKYGLAINIINDYLKDNPEDAKAVFRLGLSYYWKGENDVGAKKENFLQAVELFDRSLSCVDPDDLGLKAENYSYLARIYFAQGKNALAKEMIDQTLRIRPQQRSIRQLKRVMLESSLSGRERKIFEKLLNYNLGQIINFCQTYNIKIILLGYPHESSCSIREMIASKYKVPFIDIGAGFTQALSKYRREDLFSADGNHPNAKGYKLMAETIFQVLRSEKTGVF